MIYIHDWDDLSMQASTSNVLNETAVDVDLTDVTDELLGEDAAGFEQVCISLFLVTCRYTEPKMNSLRCP